MEIGRPAISFFISIHIPKTGGTTVGSVFDRVLYRRVLFDYPSPESRDEPDAELSSARGFISSWFAGIHGHFAARRHLACHPQAKYLATLRHPVERIISQYIHELNDATPDAPWHDQIASGEMDVLTFASQDGVRNAMCRHLEGLDAVDFDFLLITERLNLSFHLLNFVIGNLDIPAHYGDPPRLPLLNDAAERPLRLQFDECTRQQIYNVACEDVELYIKALERLDRMTRRFLR